MKNKLLNIFICMLMAILFVVSPLQVKASSKSQYYGAVLFDYSGYRLSYTIYQDGGELLEPIKNYSDHTTIEFKEEDFKDNFLLTDNGVSEDISDRPGKDKGYLNYTYLAFPGYYPLDNFSVYVTDFDQANDVIGGLISSINSAIAYVGRYGLYNNQIVVSTNLSLPDVAKDIALTTKKAIASKAATLNNAKNIEIVNYDTLVSRMKASGPYQSSYKKAKEEIDDIVNHSISTYRQGITTSDFVVIREINGNAEPLVAMWKCPKGYSAGGYLYERTENFSTNGNLRIGSPDISWTGLVTYANSAAEQGLFADSDGWSEFVTMGKLEKYIAEFASSITNKGAKVLGLNTVEELVFNREGRGSNYYLGMMPYMWFQVSNALFWVFQIIAVFVLLASILWAVYKQNYAVISPSERTNLQDHIANLLISIFLLAIYVPIFYILGKSNQMIVSMFNTMTAGKSLTTSISLGWLVSLVFSIFNLVILAKLNITYLIRAATITLLHIISPLVIASMSISGSRRGSLFNIWLKEMASAIFMQSFDAIVLALFIMISSYGGVTNTWESLMLMFMLIPLNNWFKERITGSNGIINTAKQVGGELGQRAGAFIGGAATVIGSSAAASKVEKELEEKNPYIENTNNSGTRNRSTGVKQTDNGMKKESVVSQEGLPRPENGVPASSSSKKNTNNVEEPISGSFNGENVQAYTNDEIKKGKWTSSVPEYEKDKNKNHIKNAAKATGAMAGVAIGSIVGGNVGSAISGASTKLYNPVAFDRSKYENAYNAVEQVGNEWDSENYDYLHPEVFGKKYDDENAILSKKQSEAEDKYDEEERQFFEIAEKENEKFTAEENIEHFSDESFGQQRADLFREASAYYKSMGSDESLARKQANTYVSNVMDKMYDTTRSEKGEYVHTKNKNYDNATKDVNNERLKMRIETSQNNLIKNSLTENHKNNTSSIFENNATAASIKQGYGIKNRDNYIDNQTEKYRTEATKFESRDKYINAKKEENKPVETREERIHSRIKEDAIDKHDKYEQKINRRYKEVN